MHGVGTEVCGSESLEQQMILLSLRQILGAGAASEPPESDSWNICWCEIGSFLENCKIIFPVKCTLGA